MKKIVSLITFVVFYILSICTCNFLYLEYTEYPLLSFIFSLLTVISFLCVTVVFSKSKKFLMIMSVYFAIVLIITIFAITFDGFASLPFLIYILPVLFILSFELPTTHFFNGINDLLKNFNIHISNDYSPFVLFTLIILLFYATYFICNKYGKKKNN